jgi:hypothetical protein
MLWETMNGRTLNIPDNPMAGIVDPRVPYYIYLQSNASSVLTGDPIYRDGGFVTILMGGSGDPNLVPTATQNTRTAIFGVYPVGGVFQANNNGVSSTFNNTAGILGAVPQRFYTFADLKFNEAELMITNNLPGGEAGARAALSDAIDAAFAHINKTVGGQSQTIPMAATVPVISDATRNTFRNAVLARFDVAPTPDAKLEIIMVQKWIHNVNNSYEAYNALRRTGFPRLINPRTHVMRDPATGAARVTNNSFNFPNTMGYPWSEVNTNQSIEQKDLINLPKPFWMTIDLNSMIN